LQFAHQEQSEDVVEVSVEQNRSADWGMASFVVYCVWMKFGSCLDLGSQIRRGSKQKPAFRIRANGDLRLRSGFPAEGPRS
jgi:hypothetical protein